MAELKVIAVVDLDRFDDSDTKSCDRQYSFEVNLRLELLKFHRDDNPLHLDYSRHYLSDGFVGLLRTAMILYHLGLEYNLMNQYLVSLSSLLKIKRKINKNKSTNIKIEFFAAFSNKEKTIM